MPQPRYRLTCCLCGKFAPIGSDVYALDREWQRRFPQMNGTLACERCATGTEWSCQTRRGGYVRGHIAAVDGTGKAKRIDLNSWDHIQAQGTQNGMIRAYPWSGLLQGAEEYLRSLAAQRSRAHPDATQRLRVLLEEWDMQTH